MSLRIPIGSTPFGTLVRVVLSSPILLLILMLAVSAAAEEPAKVDEREALSSALAPWALELAAPPPASRRILGLDISAMTGSLVDDRLHLQSGYALPWGRGPLDLGGRALGLAWGWRF